MVQGDNYNTTVEISHIWEPGQFHLFDSYSLKVIIGK